MSSSARIPRLRILRSDELTDDEIDAIRRIMSDAFETDPEGVFTDDDWDHALGGRHFLLDVEGELVTHAAIVERTLEIGGRALRTGYVEAVATAPAHDGNGFGSLVMEAVTANIRDGYELGALGTGRHHFYERLGWETWRGQAFVRKAEEPTRTPDDEGYILVLRTAVSPAFELTDSISCEWRPGDVW